VSGTDVSVPDNRRRDFRDDKLSVDQIGLAPAGRRHIESANYPRSAIYSAVIAHEQLFSSR
jgi:hypothetical protein